MIDFDALVGEMNRVKRFTCELTTVACDTLWKHPSLMPEVCIRTWNHLEARTSERISAPLDALVG